MDIERKIDAIETRVNLKKKKISEKLKFSSDQNVKNPLSSYVSLPTGGSFCPTPPSPMDLHSHDTSKNPYTNISLESEKSLYLKKKKKKW